MIELHIEIYQNNNISWITKCFWPCWVERKLSLEQVGPSLINMNTYEWILLHIKWLLFNSMMPMSTLECPRWLLAKQVCCGHTSLLPCVYCDGLVPLFQVSAHFVITFHFPCFWESITFLNMFALLHIDIKQM